MAGWQDTTHAGGGLPGPQLQLHWSTHQCPEQRGTVLTLLCAALLPFLGTALPSLPLVSVKAHPDLTPNDLFLCQISHRLFLPLVGPESNLPKCFFPLFASYIL